MEYIKRCECCGTANSIDENSSDVIMMPFPHVVCKSCHSMIPLF